MDGERTKYWRSLEERAEADVLRELSADEFAGRAPEPPETVSRRQFLGALGAAVALAGCSRPPRETIRPYVRRPEDVLPGRPLYFATAMTLGGFATGLLVESHEGRPIKVEGNPEHPSGRGATDPFAQAAILGLYDPGRSGVVTYRGRPSTWERAVETLRAVARRQGESKGRGLRVLTETVTSPSLRSLFAELRESFPDMRWHQYEPLNRDEALAGARLAFGEDVTTLHRFGRADVIVSLDADFLGEGPERLSAAREFIARRRVWDKDDVKLNRLYVVESGLSITGAKADHRLALPARDVEAFARLLAGQLVERLAGKQTTLSDAQRRWANAVVRDVQARGRGKTLFVAGRHQPAAVHALCHLMNDALGNVGATVEYVEPVEAKPGLQGESLRTLVGDMNEGRVEALLILGGNPVYTAPVDLDFAGALDRVPLRFHLSLHQDETSRLCHWHLPEAHFLETWGDARAHDGTVTVQQPLIAPLYEGARSALEVLAALSRDPGRSGHELVRAHWRQARGGEDFEAFWNTALHDGLIPDTASPARRVRLRDDLADPQERPGGLELVFRPDPALYDGRFATNGWLQELPRPLTRLTWENCALMSPATAERLGISFGRAGTAPDLHAPEVEVVRLRLPNRAPVEAPVWVLPGHPDDSVTVHLGYGRTRAGATATGKGFNATLLRSSRAAGFESGLVVERTGKRHSLPSVQHHHLMENRALVRAGSVDAHGHAHLEHEERHHPVEGTSQRVPLTLYPPKEYSGHKWAMAIDLTSCIGCAACVVACQAENNIPVVGPDEVRRGRAMHWLRIDRYFAGERDTPTVHFQPVPCMHCENAPCEPVCPVAATVHSDEGLNDMVYNRCVGTRYCQNNCPYKVRRFNFLEYQDWDNETLRLGRNPDVTVRSRGVMEKCTYCVQRINAGRIEAEKQGRGVRDGEVVTACQAACPTAAIVFGDWNDAASKVTRAKQSPLNYGLLTELNTEPRTTYLGEVRNPNPDPDLGAS